MMLVGNGRPSHYGRQYGFTTIELIIVVAIVGVFVGLAIRGFGDDASRTARDIGQLTQQARLEAVKQDAPAAIVWNEGNETLEVRVLPRNAPATCADAGTVVRRLDLSGRRVASVQFTIAGGGMIWLPSNFARTCSNTAFAGTGGSERILVEGFTNTFEVVVSAGGLVTIE